MRCCVFHCPLVALTGITLKRWWDSSCPSVTGWSWVFSPVSASQPVRKDLPRTVHTILMPAASNKMATSKFLQPSLSRTWIQGLCCYPLLSISPLEFTAMYAVIFSISLSHFCLDLLRNSPSECRGSRMEQRRSSFYSTLDLVPQLEHYASTLPRQQARSRPSLEALRRAFEVHSPPTSP